MFVTPLCVRKTQTARVPPFVCSSLHALLWKSHFDERDTKLPADYKMHASCFLPRPQARLQKWLKSKNIISICVPLKNSRWCLSFFAHPLRCVTKLLNSYTLQRFRARCGIISSRGGRFKIQLQQTICVSDSWHPRACTRERSSASAYKSQDNNCCSTSLNVISRRAGVRASGNSI